MKIQNIGETLGSGNNERQEIGSEGAINYFKNSNIEKVEIMTTVKNMKVKMNGKRIFA